MIEGLYLPSIGEVAESGRLARIFGFSQVLLWLLLAVAMATSARLVNRLCLLAMPKDTMLLALMLDEGRASSQYRVLDFAN